MSKVFLSYSRKDSRAMQQLRYDLEAESIELWTDIELEPGTLAWQKTIAKEIEHAGCFVVILSPNAKESEWVNREIDYAITFGVKIFPVLFYGDQRSAIPISLIRSQWVDMRENYKSSIFTLTAAIKNHLNLTRGLRFGENNIRSNEYEPHNNRIVWTPSEHHSNYPHVIADSDEGKWAPSPGYKWVDPKSKDFQVVWSPGTPHGKYPNFIAGSEKGK